MAAGLEFDNDTGRYPMRSITTLVLAAAALSCTAASAQLIEPRTANQRTLVDIVSTRLTSCFTTLGPKRAFPVASAAPPQRELWAAVLLAASGARVAAGYSYLLLLHGPSNAAFVVQGGGFAAQRKVFGPLPLETDCREPVAAG
jgi:hypothetical protein